MIGDSKTGNDDNYRANGSNRNSAQEHVVIDGGGGRKKRNDAKILGDVINLSAGFNVIHTDHNIEFTSNFRKKGSGYNLLNIESDNNIITHDNSNKSVVVKRS